MELPNILLIMTDQQQAALRKGAGYTLDTMPCLDKLAASGTDFANAYTPNPTCCPARVSLFTGRYASCHKVRTNHNVRDALYTEDLLDVLKDAGYVTALCGKNHTYLNAEEAFDFCAANGHLGEERGRDCEPQSEDFSEFRTFLQETRFIDSAVPTPFPLEVQLPYRNVSAALRFLDRRPQDKPFFAWVSFAEPHNPYQVPAPYFDLFPPECLPKLSSAEADLRQKGERFVWLKNTWREILGDDPARLERMRSNYHGMLRLIDDQLARLLAGLEERGLRDNTIIIYVSDHGDFAGEYGMMRKGPDLPDVLTRIPMIWSVPGMPARGRVDGVYVSLIDILPTVCDFINVPIPFGGQGKSIRPLLRGEACPDEFDVAYSESGYGGMYWTAEDELDICAEGASQNRETFDCLNTWTQCGQVRMVVKNGFKLQMDMLGNCLMYDLCNDPHELCNLWGNPQYAAQQTELAAAMAAAMMRADDPLPPPHRRYRVKRHPKNYVFTPYRSQDTGVTDAEAIYRRRRRKR